MNHFKSLASLYNPGKYQQTFGFLMFSGEKEVDLSLLNQIVVLHPFAPKF